MLEWEESDITTNEDLLEVPLIKQAKLVFCGINVRLDGHSSYIFLYKEM
jgi:hypothetical protein